MYRQVPGFLSFLCFFLSPVQEVALKPPPVRVGGRRGVDERGAVAEAEAPEEALRVLGPLLRLKAVRLSVWGASRVQRRWGLGCVAAKA